MSEGFQSINPKQYDKLSKKAKELGYEKVEFFIDDLDMLLRPTNLLKEKDMKYFELENLISLLDSKKISLGMAPRMISMVSRYAERNEELETENSQLKQENIANKSKAQSSEALLKELQNQLQNLSAAPQQDAKIREENIKITEENKYLKMTNESLTEDFKKTKDKLEVKVEEANNLEIENNQLEMRMKDIQRRMDDLQEELQEAKKSRGVTVDKTLKKIEAIIEELDQVYGTIDDPFKKEFLAFLGVELSEIIDDRHISKQKILNQIAIHAHEIEKIFEPRIKAFTQQPVITMPTQPQPIIKESITPVQESKSIIEKVEEKIPQPVIRQVSKVEPVTIVEEEEEEKDVGDRYVKPSEFLKGKTMHQEKTTQETEKKLDEDAEDIPAKKPVTKTSYSPRGRKPPAEVDRTPSPELIKVFDIFIKYLEAINDNNSFNDLCDKLIEQLYEHVGSPGMTQVYKIKSGGIKRKQMLIDLIISWKSKLPDL